MTRSTGAMTMLLVYGTVLFCVGIWAARRTHNASDYLLASRRLAFWPTALSFTANAAAPWLLLVVCGTAFTWGLVAVWMAAALLAGCLLNWLYVAPRLRALSVAQGGLTILQLLSATNGERFTPLVARCGVAILFVALLLQASAQLHLAGSVLAVELHVDLSTVVAWLAIFLGIVTIAGGYWAATISDVLQVAVLLLIGLLLPALIAARSWSAIQAGITVPALPSGWFAEPPSVIAVAFVIGMFGIGLAQLGQPQALNRFLSAKDERTLRSARWVSCGMVVLLLGGMLVCGWLARILYAGLKPPELALLTLSSRLLPPWLGGAVSSLLLGAVLSGLINQWLVLAATFSIDVKRATNAASIDLARAVTAICALLASCLVVYAPAALLDRWMLAYSVMGASFGPLLLVQLTGKRVRPGASLGAMWAGCVLTLLFHWLPDSPGDMLERALPFVAALGIALTGGERRHHPDRADRAQETVHDRVPI